MRIAFFSLLAGSAVLLAGCGKAVSRAGPVSKTLLARASKALKWADKAQTAYDAYQKATAARPPNRPRFPYPVQRVSDQLLILDPARGIYAAQNNWNGFIFYDSFGQPVGFSAFNRARGGYDYFDGLGYLVGRH